MKWQYNVPHDHKNTYGMAIKYTKIFHVIDKIGIFGMQKYHLATLALSS
jgi:hypothetical protein